MISDYPYRSSRGSCHVQFSEGNAVRCDPSTDIGSCEGGRVPHDNEAMETVHQAFTQVVVTLSKRRILQLAQAIEPSAASGLTWYYDTPIDEFDGRTADDLIRKGDYHRVARFLLDISNGLRG